MHSVGVERISKRPDDVLLSNHLAKLLWPPFSRQDLITHRGDLFIRIYRLLRQGRYRGIEGGNYTYVWPGRIGESRPVIPVL
jgi:hypothetical protein